MVNQLNKRAFIRLWAISGIIIFLLPGCKSTPENSMLECEIFSKSKVIQGRAIDVIISVVPTGAGMKVSRVGLFVDGDELETIDSLIPNYEWITDGFDTGVHSFKVVLYNQQEQIAEAEIEIELIPYEIITSITDNRDGIEYKVVEIGNQLWMAENLRYEHEYAYHIGRSKETITTYGYLYDTKYGRGPGACPAEWHIPTPDEWDELIDLLGGEDSAGGKLKETSISYWKRPNTGATNESGFTALPAGSLDWNKIHEGLGETARFFSSQYGTYYFLDYQSETVEKVVTHPYGEGYSIRCVRNY